MLGIIHDENAFDIELDATLVIAVKQIKRCLCRNIKKRGITLVTFDLVVNPCLRILEIMTYMLVEFPVLIITNVLLVLCP